MTFIEHSQPILKPFANIANDIDKLARISEFYRPANAPKHPIRNRLMRLTIDSPDLLAIIKEEGTA